MKSDVEIQKDVLDELNWQPLLDAAQVGVAVKGGVVTLSGIVDTYAKKIAAEEAAKKVSGVKAVALDIEVKLMGTGKKTDTELANSILAMLKWNSAIKEERVKVKVEDAWVTLNGEVEWEYERNTVKNAVERLDGVRGITNNIILKPKASPTEIKRKILAAFSRRASIDANNIEIETLGSKVILTGRVQSLLEKTDAENAVWAAPGITEVENKLEVGVSVPSYI